jgi:hypothetical protein
MPDPRDRSDDAAELEAPPSDQELASAAELRHALDDPRLPNDDADLARALASAWSPRDLAPHEHRALVEQALLRQSGASRRRGKLLRVSFVASTVVALAAAVLLVLRGRPSPDLPRIVPGFAVSRSTQPLFLDRFAATGGETSRIDRIAMARSADLRDNEFAKWGVR